MCDLRNSKWPIFVHGPLTHTHTKKKPHKFFFALLIFIFFLPFWFLFFFFQTNHQKNCKWFFISFQTFVSYRFDCSPVLLYGSDSFVRFLSWCAFSGHVQEDPLDDWRTTFIIIIVIIFESEKKKTKKEIEKKKIVKKKNKKMRSCVEKY